MTKQFILTDQKSHKLFDPPDGYVFKELVFRDAYEVMVLWELKSAVDEANATCWCGVDMRADGLHPHQETVREVRNHD